MHAQQISSLLEGKPFVVRWDASPVHRLSKSSN
jgi:hypothetical protein